MQWILVLLALAAEADALSPSPRQQLTQRASDVRVPDRFCKSRKRSCQAGDRSVHYASLVHRRSRAGRFCTSRLRHSLDDDEDGSDDGSSSTDGGNPKNPNEPTSRPKTDPKPSSLLNMINPYNAGKSLRSKVESAIDLASAMTSTSPASRLPPERRALYYNFYLDDKLGLSSELKDSTSMLSPSLSSPSLPAPYTNGNNSYWLSSSDTDTRPEVLVVGATGELGRTLVKRLLLENKVRVRVLVRDLYSRTINKLGTGVTYCQGDLMNMESLEYAVTDLDKIVFCAGYNHRNSRDGASDGNGVTDDDEEERWRGAQNVDGNGLKNLIHAYLNVRHADYGLSQTAKRVLFKFRSSSADFDLFSVDDAGSTEKASDDASNGYKTSFKSYKTAELPALQQSSWKENKFHRGVFTGQVSRFGEAAISSVRLRSRSDPSEGLDLNSGGFAGFVCRICSNGGVYEAFVRTEAYERLGVEYVCEFRTASKSPASLSNDNTSRDKFSTVRLDFSDFRARLRPDVRDKAKQALSLSDIPRFVGKDVRQIGFRYRGENNSFTRNNIISNSGWSKFYLSFDYIKLYRGQPEPEFIYLSDARIPPVLQDGMIRDDVHRLVSASSQNINDDGKFDRSAEETYFKYKGEEIIKQSGLR